MTFPTQIAVKSARESFLLVQMSAWFALSSPNGAGRKKAKTSRLDALDKEEPCGLVSSHCKERFHSADKPIRANVLAFRLFKPLFSSIRFLCLRVLTERLARQAVGATHDDPAPRCPVVPFRRISLRVGIWVRRFACSCLHRRNGSRRNEKTPLSHVKNMIKGRFFVAEKKRRECRQEDGKKTFFATASRNLVAKIKSLYSVFYCKGLILLERETGFEPATFSLGS